MPALTRQQTGDVTLIRDPRAADGVAFAFTERSGGVSEGDFASLNLGSRCGDDPARVAENRRRALAALGVEGQAANLVCPRQVHGADVAHVRASDAAELARARAEAERGADVVVCTAPSVPVLMCFADCVPVVITCPGGFAVAHSGWRGTVARVAAVAARELCAQAGVTPDQLSAYVGPHVGAADYEVSPELAARFSAEFGPDVVVGERNLDLAAAVRAALADAGVSEAQVAVWEESTASHTDRFFSYRASGGACGRHGALACLRGEATLR